MEKRKVFVKTNDQHFEECYIKSFLLNPTWIPMDYLEIDKILEVTGNDNIKGFDRKVFYNSVEDIKNNNPTPITAFIDYNRRCYFINKRLNTNFDADTNKHSLSLTAYRWEGNVAKEITFDMCGRAYIDGFIYDYDTDKVTLNIKSMPPKHCEMQYGVINAILKGERTFKVYGWTYYFTREECEKANKLIIHRMEDALSGRDLIEATKKRITKEYEEKMEALKKEYEMKMEILRFE